MGSDFRIAQNRAGEKWTFGQDYTPKKLIIFCKQKRGFHFRPALHISRNTRKPSWNAKNKKCISAVFRVSFFPFRISRQGRHSCEKSEDFVVYFFAALIKHEIRMKYEKWIASISYFVVWFAKTFVKYLQNVKYKKFIACLTERTLRSTRIISKIRCMWYTAGSVKLLGFNPLLTPSFFSSPQDEYGQYSYGYSGGPSSKMEMKTLDGITRGGYSYIDANGILQKVNYVSDPVNGFRVSGTNLPISNIATASYYPSEYHLPELNLISHSDKSKTD